MSVSEWRIAVVHIPKTGDAHPAGPQHIRTGPRTVKTGNALTGGSSIGHGLWRSNVAACNIGTFLNHDHIRLRDTHVGDSPIHLFQGPAVCPSVHARAALPASGAAGLWFGGHNSAKKTGWHSHQANRRGGGGASLFQHEAPASGVYCPPGLHGERARTSGMVLFSDATVVPRPCWAPIRPLPARAPTLRRGPQ